MGKFEDLENSAIEFQNNTLKIKTLLDQFENLYKDASDVKEKMDKLQEIKKDIESNITNLINQIEDIKDEFNIRNEEINKSLKDYSLKINKFYLDLIKKLSECEINIEEKNEESSKYIKAVIDNILKRVDRCDDKLYTILSTINDIQKDNQLKYNEIIEDFKYLKEQHIKKGKQLNFIIFGTIIIIILTVVSIIL